LVFTFLFYISLTRYVSLTVASFLWLGCPEGGLLSEQDLGASKDLLAGAIGTRSAIVLRPLKGEGELIEF